MFFKNKFKMGIKDIGIDNKIKNKAILEILENTATYHADLVGGGIKNIQKIKTTWVLLEWKVKILNRPEYGQKLTVMTWGRDMQKACTYRDFEIYDENKKICVIATSKWALIDLTRNRLMRITEEVVSKYEPETKCVFNEVNIEKIKMPENFSNSLDYKVARRDIDLNGHMHNLYYLDLVYEVLPEEFYKNKFYDNIQISYKKEAKLGDIVRCKYAKDGEKHKVVIVNAEDENIVHAVIELY